MGQASLELYAIETPECYLLTPYDPAIEEQLRAALGVTAEQMHAYENGATRIGASLLYDVSKLLKCLPTVFFEDMKLENRAE